MECDARYLLVNWHGWRPVVTTRSNSMAPSLDSRQVAPPGRPPVRRPHRTAHGARPAHARPQV
jgi:hypothetical protein